MTFLEMLKAVARESGTVGNDPTSVENQTDRVRDMASDVQTAWNDIQRERDWLWMRDRFVAPLMVGVETYGGADLGVPRMVDLVGMNGIQPAVRAMVGDVQHDVWPEEWAVLLHRKPMQGVPAAWARDPQGSIMLWPTPNEAMTLSGIATLGPQSLVENDDVPEMPARFHRLIVLRALVKSMHHDESYNQMQVWAGEARKLTGELMRDQLPTPGIAANMRL